MIECANVGLPACLVCVCAIYISLFAISFHLFFRIPFINFSVNFFVVVWLLVFRVYFDDGKIDRFGPADSPNSCAYGLVVHIFEFV